MRLLIHKQPKLALGVQVAIAVMAGGKSHATSLASSTVPVVPNIGTLLPQGVVRKFFTGESNLGNGEKIAEFEQQSAGSADADEAETSASFQLAYEPMSYQQARLWLQSYNAGPYAVLKYKGNVPYRETRNYVPRVMKYYGQKLDSTAYDRYIVSSAAKYGLDPQLIRAVMKTESDFNARTVSHAGARGLMQVMPCVWSDVKKKYRLDWNYSAGVHDPEKNIEVACAYLAWLRYDFLPRHFANFESTVEVPAAVVRDRGIPSRKTPRISVEAPQVPTAAAYVQAVSQLRNLTAGPEERAARTAVALIEQLGSKTGNLVGIQDRSEDSVNRLKNQAASTLQKVEAILSTPPAKKKRDRVMSRGKKFSRQS